MLISVEKIIPGNGTDSTSNAIHVADGIITRVGTIDELISEFPGEEVHRIDGASLMPGLIDMHMHLGYWWYKEDKQDYNDFLVAYLSLKQAESFFEVGVTTVRETMSPHGLSKAMNLAAAKGYIRIPRIIPCDVGITMTGGHGHKGEGCIEVDGPWELRKAVRQLCKDGAQWIKVLTSHRSELPEFTQEELDTVVDEAHRLGKKIAVHAGTSTSIEMCINAGFDTIEHCTFVSEAQAIRMRDKGIAMVPTIITYAYQYNYMVSLEKDMNANPVAKAAVDIPYFGNAVQAYRDNFAKIANTGVIIATGTDLLMDDVPSSPVIGEMKLMVEFGVTPLKAIQFATYNCALVMGLENKFGQIREGAAADFLIVKGDPSKNINDMDNILEVYSGGEQVFQNCC